MGQIQRWNLNIYKPVKHFRVSFDLNSLKPDDANYESENAVTVVQVLAWHLLGANCLTEPMLTFWQLDTHRSEITPFLYVIKVFLYTIYLSTVMSYFKRYGLNKWWLLCPHIWYCPPVCDMIPFLLIQMINILFYLQKMCLCESSLLPSYGNKYLFLQCDVIVTFSSVCLTYLVRRNFSTITITLTPEWSCEWGAL